MYITPGSSQKKAERREKELDGVPHGPVQAQATSGRAGSRIQHRCRFCVETQETPEHPLANSDALL